jgi:hypothetical protein
MEAHLVSTLQLVLAVEEGMVEEPADQNLDPRLISLPEKFPQSTLVVPSSEFEGRCC